MKFTIVTKSQVTRKVKIQIYGSNDESQINKQTPVIQTSVNDQENTTEHAIMDALILLKRKLVLAKP